MQRQPTGLGADCARELGAPGSSRKHAEKALQLCWREGTISVLRAEELR